MTTIYYEAADSPAANDRFRTKEIRRYVASAAGGYLVTKLFDYDAFGNAKRVWETDTNATAKRVTCRTFDANRGWMLTERLVVDGNDTCTTPGSNDLTTTYTRDSAGRVTKVERPRGNCLTYAYDSSGRLEKVRNDDDCTGSDTNHERIVYTYDAIGNVTLEQTLDTSGTEKRRQSYTYGANGRTLKRLNPTDETEFQLYDYDGLGTLTDQEFEDIGSSGAQTVQTYDALERRASLERYTGVSTHIDTDFTYTTTGGGIVSRPTTITASNGLNTTYIYDDRGRTLEEVSPDRGTTKRVYNEADLKIKEVVAYGGGASIEETTSYTYDALGRLTLKEVGGSTCGRSPAIIGPDVYTYYDVVPSGESCPSGFGCANLPGRASLFKYEVTCSGGSPTYGKHWQSYDVAGRLEKEKREALGRTDDVVYAYDKNGHVTSVTYPGGEAVAYTYGTTGDSNKSDADEIVALSHAGTSWVTSIAHYPFGLVSTYTIPATIGGYAGVFVDTRNLAYRASERKLTFNTTDYLKLTYAEDTRGRYSQKLNNNNASLTEPRTSYYTYDAVSRLTCDSKASGACPSSGHANFKASATYDSGDNRSQYVFKNSIVTTADDLTSVFETSKNRLDYLDRAGTSSDVQYTYNARGQRTQDDDNLEQGSNNNVRDYVYYPSGQLATVSGKKATSSGSFDDYKVTYIYDHRGRRIFKSWLDTTPNPDTEEQWYFTYDAQDQLLEIRQFDDAIANACKGERVQFMWLGAQWVARYRINLNTSCSAGTSQRNFVGSDHLGAPTVVMTWPTSGNATVAATFDWDAFGWAVVSDATEILPIRFPGQYDDPETVSKYWDSGSSTYKTMRPGIFYNHHRFYDPYVGAYLDTDPVRSVPDLAFAYVSGDPVNRTDRTGLAEDDCSCGEEGEGCLEGDWCASGCCSDWMCAPASVCGGGKDEGCVCGDGVCGGSGCGEYCGGAGGTHGRWSACPEDCCDTPSARDSVDAWRRSGPNFGTTPVATPIPKPFDGAYTDSCAVCTTMYLECREDCWYGGVWPYGSVDLCDCLHSTLCSCLRALDCYVPDDCTMVFTAPGVVDLAQ